MQTKNLLLALTLTACAALGVHGKPLTSVSVVSRQVTFYVMNSRLFSNDQPSSANTNDEEVQIYGVRRFSPKHNLKRNELEGSVYINGEWSKPQDKGCDPNRAGIHVWTSTLNGAAGDLDSACTNTNATVAKVFFNTPSECQVSDIDKVATGYFDTTDTLCGIPPCPDGNAWDYQSKMCISCQTGAAPAKLNDNQLRRDLEKRVNCPQVGAFHIPGGRVVLRLANNIASWASGSEQGPTADQLASNPQVQAAFQQAWADSYTGANTMRETGGWIYMDPNNRANIFIRRAARSGPSTRISPPPTGSIGINLAHPENERTAVPEEYVLVATFHTHPSANPERYNPGLPSAQDNHLEWERGVPGIIIHDRGLTAYGPRARAQMDAAGPQDFPMANLDPGHTHENDRGNSVGNWVPSRVANQPPQSSPPASGSCWGCNKEL